MPQYDVVDADAVTLNDDVSWTITSPALSAYNGSQIASLVVTDDLVDQLNFVAGPVSGHVVAGATSTAIPAADFNNYFTVGYSTPGVAGGVLTITATTDGLTYINTLPTNRKVSFTFDTTVVGTGAISNSAEVNLGGQTFETGSATTRWGSAVVTKVDAADTTLTLEGATFELYEADSNGERPAGGVAAVGTYETDVNGQITFPSLKAGVYWLKETVAPAGYVLPTGEGAWRTFTVVVGAQATRNVENTQQSVPNLPMTGANGQLLMTIAGIALVLVAGGGALAMRNRSKSAE